MPQTATMESLDGKSNLSFVLNKPFDVCFEEKPLPASPGPHDVILAINYTGICGSDIHYWTQGSIGSYALKDPLVLGHEAAGTVVILGSEVKSLKLGDRVALEPGAPCRRCVPCRSGHYNLCKDVKFAASPPFGGTLTGFYSTPEDFCYKLPDHISLQEGVLIEPLAVAVHIVKQAAIVPGQSIVVMGAGPVGLLCCAIAKCFGASKIVSVDIQPSRLEFSAKYAASHTFAPTTGLSPEQNAENLIKECSLGDGADAVIDASGAESSIQTSLHVVRCGGHYVQGGMGKSNITFPIMALCMKEVTACGSFRYGSGDYRLAVDLVASGKVDVRSLITGTVRFQEAENAFKAIKAGNGIKVLIAGPNEQ